MPVQISLHFGSACELLVLAAPWTVCVVGLCLAGSLCVGVLPDVLDLALVSVPSFITASLAWCDRMHYHHVHILRLFSSDDQPVNSTYNTSLTLWGVLALHLCLLWG